MASRKKKRSRQDSPPADSAEAAVVDGIPDRGERRLWKYILIAVIFVGWLGFLVACMIVGAP